MQIVIGALHGCAMAARRTPTRLIHRYHSATGVPLDFVAIVVLEISTKGSSLQSAATVSFHGAMTLNVLKALVLMPVNPLVNWSTVLGIHVKATMNPIFARVEKSISRRQRDSSLCVRGYKSDYIYIYIYALSILIMMTGALYSWR
jgi:hypothetical protein